MKILKSILGISLASAIVLTFTFVFAKGLKANFNQKILNTTTSSQQQNVGCGYGFGMYTNMQELVAKALGISLDELVSKIQNGQTINDILKEKKLTVDQFKSKLYDLRVNEINKLLKDGNITKEQADFLKQHIQTYIQNCINNILNWASNDFDYDEMMGSGHDEMMSSGHDEMMGSGHGGMMGSGYGNMMGAGF